MTQLRPDLPVAAPNVLPAGHRIRGDIQGMRALAVGLVVLYHFWPGRLAGGYVGVDVFFVISGFLITGHLLRELDGSGTVRLGRFYARRIRRLLPAAILVLAVTAVAAWWMLPSSQLLETLRQIAGSATYIENWMLAGSAVDYLAQDAAPTPVQHYWSLSVEEQFYLVWPALLLLVAWLTRRTRGRAVRSAVLVALLAVGVLSLAVSIWLTEFDRPIAYFVTPTRMWEFVVGALLVFLPSSRVPDRVRAIVAWLGIAMIIGSALLLSDASPFPGSIAMFPVLGAAAAIWGGEAAARRWMPGRWLGLRPLRFLGDSSYAIYLWHWPVVVMLPIVLGAIPSTPQRLIAIGIVIVVAWLSTRFFEAPVRRARWLSGRLAPFALALVSALVAWGIWGAAGAVVQARSTEAAAQAEQLVGTPCYGAAALLERCDPIAGDPSTVDPALAAADAQNPEYTRCDQRLDEAELVTCRFGPDEATTTIALVGDSHATQWLGALARLADDRGWAVETYLKSSCPLTQATRVLDGEPRERQANCLSWQGDVRAALADADPDLILVSAYARGYQWSDGPDGPVSEALGVDGFATQWAQLADSVAPVVVLADTPYLGGINVPDCIASTDPSGAECTAPRAQALMPDALQAAVVQLARPDVVLLDLNDAFCDADTCYSVVGGEIVYRDTTHLTWKYAASVAPELARRLSTLGVL